MKKVLDFSKEGDDTENYFRNTVKPFLDRLEPGEAKLVYYLVTRWERVLYLKKEVDRLLESLKQHYGGKNEDNQKDNEKGS